MFGKDDGGEASDSVGPSHVWALEFSILRPTSALGPPLPPASHVPGSPMTLSMHPPTVHRPGPRVPPSALLFHVLSPRLSSSPASFTHFTSIHSNARG